MTQPTIISIIFSYYYSLFKNVDIAAISAAYMKELNTKNNQSQTISMKL